jgi:hypothetical protein
MKLFLYDDGYNANLAQNMQRQYLNQLKYKINFLYFKNIIIYY